MIKTLEFPGTDAPTPALIEHILARYHETHRRELPELVALAEKVEAVHVNDPNAPHGLALALKALVVDLEEHMRKEEGAVFATGGAESCKQSGRPTAALRHDHDEQEAILNKIAAITHGFRLPANACASWTRLYAGLSKLVDDMDEHMFLENTVLFPRFEVDA
ncbi:hemerythrin domain-containing protein [Vannielia sp.]|uniref:hemerythrin domain-containing protein n=1 Tax=Vannielia sp. TaxID=2813045 RepID=UPI0026108829|nr:hemerythrin domain-containing protein [Vannielia sp.]MDF1872826.1 hemerythrin domain-containing protein [Vannielia sp.]